MRSVISFDPGATTGVAVVDKNGDIVATFAFSLSELRDFVELLKWLDCFPIPIAIEVGPQFQHHSPITMQAEAAILNVFPDAVTISPGQWKGHPAADWHQLSKLRSKHERDAVGLARWFQNKERHDGDTTTENPKSTRH